MSDRSPPPRDAARHAVLPGLGASPDDGTAEAGKQGQELWVDRLRYALAERFAQARDIAEEALHGRGSESAVFGLHRPRENRPPVRAGFWMHDCSLREAASLPASSALGLKRCQAHMWTAPSLQGVLQCFDQIACVHMSGLT